MPRGLVAVLGTAVVLAAFAGSAAAKPPVTFASCAGATVKPKEVLLACGDGNAAFLVRSWSRWTRTGARAVGTAEINDCNPTCVAGHVAPYLAALVLDRPRPCHGRVRFTRLRLVFAVPPAKGQPASLIFPCR
jgi:hypothetical protein